ncbi:MAG: molecular chaperone [Spirochaetales bacterium]|nr:molecular chaperone [Spirochaetales bacterium]
MKRIIILLPFLLTSFFLYSFTFEPISTNYTPSGPRSNQVFRISNNETSRIAVKISVTTRETDLEGNEVNNPADDLFMIYPSRTMLNPGETRSVRVKWLGEQDPDVEIPFRIIAEQIPVDFNPTERTEGGGIRLSYKYIGNIYILPVGGKPEVVIDSFELNRDELTLMLDNQGTRHTVLANLSVTIVSNEGEKIYSLTEEEVAPGSGINLLTGFPRKIIFTLNSETVELLKNDGWEVAIDFDPVF